MSSYGYFACMDCKVVFWLGKAVLQKDEHQSVIDCFHRGDASEPPNWARETLNRVLWTMLAKHRGHTLRVVLDDELERLEAEDSYREIGGDGLDHIPLKEYLET